MTKKKNKVKDEEVKVEIDFNIPDSIVTRFATNMTIQTIENEFKISFFELKMPLDFSVPKKPPKTIRADCVASVIVTVDRLPKFINAMQAQLGNFMTKHNIEIPKET